MNPKELEEFINQKIAEVSFSESLNIQEVKGILKDIKLKLLNMVRKKAKYNNDYYHRITKYKLAQQRKEKKL